MSDIMQRDPLPSNRGYTANIKLDTLLSYTPNRRRDAWQSMGSMTVDFNNKVFSRNSIFRLVNTTGNTCPLSGYFFFVAEEDIQLTSSFSWSNMQLGLGDDNLPDGSIIDSLTHIIHPNIYWIMSPAEYSAIVAPYDDTFIPFGELQGVGVDPNSTVIIPEDELNQILIDLGVPFIKIDELEYSRAEILNLMILPAMKEYFKWFPITTRTTHPINTTFFEIDIPAWANGVVTAYVNPMYLSNASASNPFSYFSELSFGGFPGAQAPVPNINTRRRRGFPDTQAMSTMIMERAVRQSVVNYGKRQRVAVHLQQGKVNGYANTVGILEITWASFSNQWQDIPFNRQTEVRKLAKAYVLRSFGMLRSQAKSDIPGTISYESFITRAETLEAEVAKFFAETTKASLVRT